MKWLLLLLLLYGIPVNTELAPNVMNNLALQIPGISTGTTTPTQMHEAWRRYESTVLMFLEESRKYRKLCYKAIFQYEKEAKTELLMLHGVVPEKVCDYLTRQLRSGHPVPEPHMIFDDIKRKK
jgi:hypothetical protein